MGPQVEAELNLSHICLMKMKNVLLPHIELVVEVWIVDGRLADVPAGCLGLGRESSQTFVPQKEVLCLATA